MAHCMLLFWVKSCFTFFGASFLWGFVARPWAELACENECKRKANAMQME